MYYGVRQPRGYTQGSKSYEHLFKPNLQGKVGKVVRLENLQRGKEECKVKIGEVGAGANLAAYEKPRRACGSTWATWSDLARHMIKIHNVQLPPKPETGKKVSCQICKTKFSRKSSLKRHMKNHTNDIKKESLGIYNFQSRTDPLTPPLLILEHMKGHWLSKSNPRDL